MIASAVRVPGPVHNGTTFVPPSFALILLVQCNVTKPQDKYEETTGQYELRSTVGKYENYYPVGCFDPPIQSATKITDTTRNFFEGCGLVDP